MRIVVDERDREEQLRKALDAAVVKAEFDKRKDEVLHLLDRLGLSGDADAYGQEAIKDPLLYLNQVSDDMISSDMNTMSCYQLVHELCTGMSTFEVISGRTKLGVTFDGLDLFHILPASPPILELLLEINAIRRKKQLKPLKERNV